MDPGARPRRPRAVARGLIRRWLATAGDVFLRHGRGSFAIRPHRRTVGDGRSPCSPRAIRQMNPSLTDTLCTRCGLCCDGSLFADVELANRAEATGLELMGLEIEDDDANGALLTQPC